VSCLYILEVLQNQTLITFSAEVFHDPPKNFRRKNGLLLRRDKSKHNVKTGFCILTYPFLKIILVVIMVLTYPGFWGINRVMMRAV
jgi:hypothetical protein